MRTHLLKKLFGKLLLMKGAGEGEHHGGKTATLPRGGAAAVANRSPPHYHRFSTSHFLVKPKVASLEEAAFIRLKPPQTRLGTVI